ncbi:MAG: hypothetical protein A2X49_04825 [Lentisphaerae bacterium GWF2_52_8]|nr:MAG: hypothetical protein A2X49_04825 [Lentisphaerae bacterium GWF2_52_8]
MESDWIELSKYLKVGKPGEMNRVSFGACMKERGDLLDASYTIYFSSTPSMDGLIKTFKRVGGGSSASFRINLLERDKIADELELSEEDLRRSESAQAYGKAPKKFIFSTGCAIDSSMDRTLDNELQALKNIGINRINFSPKYGERFKQRGFDNAKISFYTWNLRANNESGEKCFMMPKTEGIINAVEKAEAAVSEYPAGIKVQRLAGMADEPGLDYLKHVPECKTCINAFPAYLKKMNVPFPDLKKELIEMGRDASSIDEIKPTADPKSPMLFYWTSRFGINTVTEFCQLCTKTAEKASKEWRTTMNFGNLRGSLAGRGLDWFELFNSGAMTYGENEDYMAWVKCFQVRGFPMAVMRAACRKSKISYGPLAAYPSSSQWLLVCGGFSQIGQGAKSFHLFNYGPHYISTSSPCSSMQWVHDATKHLTYAVGEVEDILCDAEVMPGDAALLLSCTSDIWNKRINISADFGNLYGMERLYLYLLLRNLHVRPDLLSEEDLAECLPRYKVLFVTDSHLRREFAPVIKKWVQDGGVLYVGANAIAFDEYNKPLSLIEELGIKRPDWKADEDLVPGRPEYELNRRKPLASVGTPAPFNALFAFQVLEGGNTLFATTDGKPALAEAAFGKGKIIAGATFPGMEYAKEAAKNESLKFDSCTEFPAGPRQFIGKVLESSSVRPLATSSHSLLEPNLLKNGKHVIVSLANWSGMEQKAELTLRLGAKAKTIRAIRTNLETIKNTPEEIVLSGAFGAGDFVLLTLE